MSADTKHSQHDPCQLAAGWREINLASVADIRFSNVDKKSESGERPVRLCNYTDVYNNDYVTADMDFMRATASRTEIEKFGLLEGDVVVTKDSETPDDIGIPTVIDSTAPDLVCGYHLALIRPSQGEIDPTFLAKQLGHWRIARYFGRQANGTTRYGLSTGAIANVPLHLPSIEEQRTAGRTVRSLDTAIAKTEAVVAKLKCVRAGLFQDLLTRGVGLHGELRPPHDQAPQLYKPSLLGPIPREWEVTTLESVAAVDRGKFTHRPRNDPPYYGGIHPFIQTGDIADAAGNAISDASQTLSDLGASVSKEFPAGTIAVTIAANIGDTAILARPMYFPDSVVGVVAKDGNCIRWLELSLRRAKRHLDALAPQSAQKNINLTFLRPLLVPIPPISEQERCAELYECCSTQLESEATTLSKLRLLKSGLTSDLLTGRVGVPDNPMIQGEH